MRELPFVNHYLLKKKIKKKLFLQLNRKKNITGRLNRRALFIEKRAELIGREINSSCRPPRMLNQ